MTEHRCNDMLDIDIDAPYFVCDLPAGHAGNHTAEGTDSNDGRPYAVAWPRTPDTITGEVIQ